ncbi:hypothetical protein TNCT_208811 [Trichonephila clavata]|uniref:Uncharacterized protein n=1 Tax=Trichonephila clavata TaxID=2740835 RepID=A0A8X6EWQ4_TRICU|nr:hypothetical protein TNCT_208811 [Trichonephila clavata]
MDRLTRHRESVFQWFKRFLEGRESMEDEHHSGKVVDEQNATANVYRVRKLLLQGSPFVRPNNGERIESSLLNRLNNIGAGFW